MHSLLDDPGLRDFVDSAHLARSAERQERKKGVAVDMEAVVVVDHTDTRHIAPAASHRVPTCQ